MRKFLTNNSFISHIVNGLISIISSQSDILIGLLLLKRLLFEIGICYIVYFILICWSLVDSLLQLQLLFRLVLRLRSPF
jgi:hypothetical protein